MAASSTNPTTGTASYTNIASGVQILPTSANNHKERLGVRFCWTLCSVLCSVCSLFSSDSRTFKTVPVYIIMCILCTYRGHWCTMVPYSAYSQSITYRVAQSLSLVSTLIGSTVTPFTQYKGPTLHPRPNHVVSQYLHSLIRPL